MDCVAKVGIVKQLDLGLQMVRHPEIVIAQISDDPASCMPERRMPMMLALPLALREIKEADAAV